MTPAQKADHAQCLREEGWTQISTRGAQQWKDPHEGKTWTLIAAVKAATGNDRPSTTWEQPDD